MSAQIAAWGRLGQDPRAIPTKTGTPMTVSSLAIDVAEDADGQPLWLNVVCFNATAEQLLKHHKGDVLSVAGRLSIRSYTTRDGETRQQWQVIADSLVSSRTVRPAGRKRAKPSEHIGELTP